MDLPQPPADQELKNIIDKLAQFVARNGPEFEHMTKQKQKDNPKFSFLFGGTFFHYYQYRVTTEQAILKQKQRSLEQQAIVQQAINRQSIQTAPWQQHLHQIQDTSQEQIRQSEQNLAAQHQLLLQQQQVQVDEIIRKAQEEKMTKLAQESEIDLKELDGVLQPIIDSCTKDSISTGKGWIFSHATSPSHSEVIVMYILKKVTEPGATFEAKLHLVYLINDVLHHCIRKNADDLKKVLERVVVPIFCSTSIGVDADKQQKLSKLHKLWETNKYFEQNILDQLQNPAASLAAYQAGLIAEYAALITPITAAVQAQYSLLQKQHQDFVAHLTGQMHQMQMPVPYAFQSPQSVMMPTQPAIAASPYIHPARPPYDPQTMPPAPPAPDIRMQTVQQMPEEAQKTLTEYPPMQSMRPVETTESESKQMENVESEPPTSDSNKSEAKNETMPSEPEPPSSDGVMSGNMPAGMPSNIPGSMPGNIPGNIPGNMSGNIPGSISSNMPGTIPGNIPGTMPGSMPGNIPANMPGNIPGSMPGGMGHGHDYPPPPPPDMCEPGYGPPDIPPSRHPNGRPIGPPPRYMDDYSPRYGHGPPPGYGGEPPEYNITPPHMGSYGRRMPYRDGPIGAHHDMPPDYMEPPFPPPCSPPYYDLPAGLMVPLVRLEDTDYDKPLEPDDVHLPPPALPTERLLAAVEQFYCPPTHERTRNNSYVISSDGWEQLGLYEFFKAKAQAKKQKGMPDDRNYDLNNDFPGAPGFSEKKEEKRRRYREFKSPEPENIAPSRNGSKSKRRSRSISRSRSRSRTPEPSPRRSSRSPSPRPHFSRSRRRSRSRSPIDKGRSPDRNSSPPYLGSGSNPREHRLDESNKGHQLLRKMGWGGAGLGAAEQGIQDPVDAGDVRDRQDMYKGIGSNLNDPYENFRKSKGQAFINRMKARAEELGKI